MSETVKNEPHLEEALSVFDDISARRAAEYEAGDTRHDPIFTQSLRALSLPPARNTFLRPHMAIMLRSHAAQGIQLPLAVIPNAILRAAHFEATQRRADTYLNDFGPDYPGSIERWHGLFDEIDADPGSKFQEHLNTHLVHSCLPERIAGIALVMALFPERFGTVDNRSALDIGASLNIHLPMLSVSELRAGIRDIEVLGIEDRDKPDPELTKRARELLTSRQELVSSGVGVDVTDVRNPQQREWAVASSVTPREMMADPRRADELSLLAETGSRCPGINFAQLDFLADAPGSHLPSALPVQKFNTAFAVTMGYLLREPQRQKLMSRMLEFTRDDAVIFIQDFGRPDPADPKRIIFKEDIYDGSWGYGLMVYDKKQPELGWQEMIRYESGRCKRAILGAGRLAVTEKSSRSETISDRLLRQK